MSARADDQARLIIIQNNEIEGMRRTLERDRERGREDNRRERNPPRPPSPRASYRRPLSPYRGRRDTPRTEPRRRSASPATRRSTLPSAGSSKLPPRSRSASPAAPSPAPASEAPSAELPALGTAARPAPDPHYDSLDSFLSEDDDDESDVEKKTKRHNQRMARRRGKERTQANAATPGAALPSTERTSSHGMALPQTERIGSHGMARHHGAYADAEIDTIDDARKLLKAAETNNDACRYLDWINSQLQKSTGKRTVGQQEIVTRWSGFLAFNKERRNAARAEAGLPPASNLARRSSRRPPAADSGDTLQRMDIDVAPTGTVQSAEERRTHDEWFAALLPTQRLYAGATPSQWPAGMRQDVQGVPTWVAPAQRQDRLTPWAGDAEAASHARELAPLRRNHDAASNIRRQEFLRLFWSVWNTPGLFARLTTELGLRPGHRPLEHFPFATSNMTPLTVVLWVLDHGIGPDSRLIPMFESYAPHTIRDQPSLAPLIVHRPIEDWIAEFGALLHAESHTLRYPPSVESSWTTVTEIEVQIRDRTFLSYYNEGRNATASTSRPADSTVGTAASEGVSADTASTTGSTVAPVDPSADTGIPAADGSTGPPTGLEPTDVDMSTAPT